MPSVLSPAAVEGLRCLKGLSSGGRGLSKPGQTARGEPASCTGFGGNASVPQGFVLLYKREITLNFCLPVLSLSLISG